MCLTSKEVICKENEDLFHTLYNHNRFSINNHIRKLISIKECVKVFKEKYYSTHGYKGTRHKHISFWGEVRLGRNMRYLRDNS